MKTRTLLSISLFLVVLVPGFACERHADADKILTVADCAPYCERLTECSGDTIRMMAQRRPVTPELMESAQRLGSKRACMSTCGDQVRPINLFRHPQAFKFHQYFLRGQMDCLSQPDCAKFSVCRQAQMTRAIAEYPMDATDARRCDEVCTRVNQCANLLVPRIYAAEYSKMPLDQQADMVRRHGDRDRCLHSCRYASIKNRLENRKLSSTIDENWEDLQPFMQCLAHTDCAEFTRCVTAQSTGTSY